MKNINQEENVLAGYLVVACISLILGISLGVIATAVIS